MRQGTRKAAFFRARLRRHGDEGGFALLVVFLMAAAVAFTLYMEMPRVAFETAREREQLLIDRGNQYKRAIQVYYAVNKRYPAKIEDLENTNNVRFLRHRYKNPLNGKEEWRLVHTNGSFLTDSLVEKPPAQNAQNGQPGNQVPGAGPLGANNLNTNPGGATNNTVPNDPNASPPAPVALNAAAMARPSDRPTLQGTPQNPGGRGAFAGNLTQNGDPNLTPGSFYNPGGFNPAGINPGGFNPSGGRAYDPSDPSTWPAITIAQPAAQNGQPGANNNGAPNFANGNFQNGNQNNFQNGQNGAVQVNPGGPFAQGQPFGNANGLPGQPFGNANGGIQGQSPGFGGQNPQQVSLSSGNPNPDTVLNTGESQPAPVTNPAPSPAPAIAAQPPSPGGNPALSLIGNQLASAAPTQNNAPFSSGGFPAPGGVPGSLPGSQGNGAQLQVVTPTAPGGAAPLGGTTGGPGIAGVASTFEGPSIKSYRERLKYQEWEFVYQPAQQGQGGIPQQGNPLGQGQNSQNPQSPGQSNPLGNQPGNPNQTGAPNNPFSNTPNPFAPQAPTQ